MLACAANDDQGIKAFCLDKDLPWFCLCFILFSFLLTSGAVISSSPGQGYMQRYYMAAKAWFDVYWVYAHELAWMDRLIAASPGWDDLSPVIQKAFSLQAGNALSLIWS